MLFETIWLTFNRYRNTAGTRVTKWTENKLSLTTGDEKLRFMMMQLIKKGSNPAAFRRIKSVIEKMDQNKPSNSRFRTRFAEQTQNQQIRLIYLSDFLSDI